MHNRILTSMIFVCLIVCRQSIASSEEPTNVKANPSDFQSLVVSARAVEHPLQRYRLLPAEYELKDGNAAPILLRLPWDEATYFSQVVPTFADYLDLPLDDPKVQQSGRVFYDRFYNELRRAAFRRFAEWEYPIGEKPLASIMLPDVQGGKQVLDRGLSVWIRYQLSQDNVSQALEGVKVGLANSRHYARTPFAITQLVCATINGHMIERLEEIVSNAGCPNLYWALSALPRPLIDLSASAQMEQRMLKDSLPILQDFSPFQSHQDWQKVARRIVEIPHEVKGSVLTDEVYLQTLTVIADHARANFDKWASDQSRPIDEMSDSEILVRWVTYFQDDVTQQIAAYMALEPPLAIQRLAILDKELAHFRGQAQIGTLFTMQGPLHLYLSVYSRQRKIDALRIVEALRHYAANHDSLLPESLSDISDTPIPLDPLTGAPFEYTLNGDTASLTAAGIEVNDRVRGAINYRITIRKPE